MRESVAVAVVVVAASIAKAAAGGKKDAPKQDPVTVPSDPTPGGTKKPDPIRTGHVSDNPE